MAKEKMQMEVGKRYKGYGVLNEYGEYLFTPCQKLEPSEKNMKIVRSNGSATLYESKNCFKLSVTIPKSIKGFGGRVHEMSIGIERAMKLFKEYI
jgi:hypothetical protein